MTGILLFTYYLAFYLNTGRKLWTGEFFRSTSRLVVSAVLAAGISGFIFVPTVFPITDCIMQYRSKTVF